MNEVPKEFLEMVENDIARIDQAVKMVCQQNAGIFLEKLTAGISLAL